MSGAAVAAGAPAAGAPAAEASGARVLADASLATSLRVSVLLAVVWGTDHPGLQGVLLGAGVAMLAWPRLLVSPAVWLACAAVLGGWLYGYGWDVVSQHKILVFYWTLACGIGLLARDAGAALRTSARLMLGVTFGLATFWKCITGEYFTGAFFEFLILWREELFAVSSLAGGIDAETLRANYAALAALRDGAQPQEWVPLASSPRLGALSIALSWWTLAIEGAMAWGFLRRPPERFAWVPHVLLMIFVVTADVVFPYPGFALALVVMGITAAGPERVRIRRAYGIAFLLVNAAIFLFHGAPYGRTIDT